MDCIQVPDNKVISFFAGVLVTIVVIIGGFIMVQFGDH